jgi:glycosyltransferase involved in cell wall biosynthesis
MRILGFGEKDSGCAYHRVALPLGFMEDVKAIVTNMPRPEMLNQKWDIVLFNRISPFDNDFNEARLNLGAKVVVDLDDDWDLPYSHIIKSDFELIRPRLVNNIKNADLVTVTNERIAYKASKLNKNVEILPNALPFGLEYFTDDKEPSDLLRLFWCGSITHERDLRILSGPLQRLDGRGIEMVIGGYNDLNDRTRNIWTRMVNVFTNYQKLPFRILRGISPIEYMKLYRHADVMLIPLEASPWHAAKSNLKLLEAACKKIPAIVSKVEPYSRDADAPVLWVEKQSDWIKHIKYLKDNEEKRKDLGEALYQWAVSKYNLFNINPGRRECFTDLIKA